VKKIADHTSLYAAGVPTTYAAKDGVLSSKASKRWTCTKFCICATGSDASLVLAHDW